MEQKNYKIDATGKKVGRLATEVAVLLMGKNLTSYARNIVANVKVEVINTSKMSIDEKKLVNKKYKRFSGYPGGLKELEMEKVIAKKGFSEILKLAVNKMIPQNKLKSKLVKNLKISE
jgi:large subunit ribosomal protein L13